VPELVALDFEQGPRFVDLVSQIWERGDAVCVLDQRLVGAARATQLEALAPTRRTLADGSEIAEPSGRGVDAGDALVVLTSGSTASPRAAVLTHDAVLASALATSSRQGVDPSADRWLCCLPCAHIGGLSVLTRAVLTSTPVEVHAGFDPEAVDVAARTGATRVSLVPTALGRLHEPEAFRTILLGGAAPPEVRPANAVVTWGMTETGSGVVYDGVALDGVNVAEVGGELWIRTPTLARTYRDGTPVAQPGPDGMGGWFPTGDGGTVLDGVVTVHGRLADVITTGGEKVWPLDVERVLNDQPNVRDAAVWRRVDPEWGERVVAFVVPGDPAPSLDELRDAVRSALPVWAAPKELVLLDALPHTASGKLDRRALEGYFGA
jgi:O-succinylbenzoic acid--CoA ligase